ncbi:PAS domain-containing protein [Phytohabitans sp. ZYX-F-186]|uniref:PAS domain-containing protein n=1 Tax=Phytohabitans maris TaxID=3071409 RepID=A0ABU0ZXM0_9ACTN|nr:PAS domain-containing protein [Phytohabitans sp. ZYX-F-186]MDQ7911049.1 PAS domain-containing protein [Phytohabitans sp. ZYX-F-186]
MAHVELSISEAFVPEARPTMQPELLGSLDLWTPTVAAAGEPCMLIDAEMAIVAISESACQLLGLGSPIDAVGESLLEGVLRLVDFTQARTELPDIEIEKIPPLLAISSGRLARGLLRVQSGGEGEAATVDAIATPLHDEGEVSGSLTFFCEV